MGKSSPSLLIPIGVVITLLGTIAGGAAWITSVRDISSQALAETVSIKEQQIFYRSRLYDKINTTNAKVNNQNTRLSRIEGKIDMLIQEVQKIK
jgi:hypothetical protein